MHADKTDIVWAVNRIKMDGNILAQGFKLGLYVPAIKDVGNDGLVGNVTKRIVEYYCKDKMNTLLNTTLRTIGTESKSDITIKIVDQLDFTRAFYDSTLITALQNMVIAKTRRRIDYSHFGDTKIRDFYITDVFTFNGFAKQFFEMITADFEFYCKHRSLKPKQGKFLVVDTKSDNINQQWRIQKKFLDNISKWHDVSSNPCFR